MAQDSPETALAQVESALIDLGAEPIATTQILEVVEEALDRARAEEERTTLLAHLEAERRQRLLTLLTSKALIRSKSFHKEMQIY